MIARALVQDQLHCLADAAPVAWRHDPVFRGAAVAVGATLALFLLCVAGSHAPDLDRPDFVNVPPALREFVPRPGAALTAAQPLTADVPKITPGHPLSNVTGASTPSADRFGTFKPGKTP